MLTEGDFDNGLNDAVIGKQAISSDRGLEHSATMSEVDDNKRPWSKSLLIS